jgi:pyruvate dehydrogenase E1 component beta subunit
MGGMRPVAEIMTINFALLAMDQVVNHAAKFHYMFGGKIRVPMVMRTVSGWGQLGATHSQTFENWFSSVPGLKVVAPATPRDAKGLLKASIEDDDPVIFIEHSLLYGIKGEVPDSDFREPLGRALVVREGTDLTIAGYSRMLHVAMRAAAQLEEQGVSAEVIDMRTLRPLDMDTVYDSVRKTHRLVVAEEDWRTIGVGAEIAASTAEECFDQLDAPVRRVAMPDVPMPYAKNLELALVPTEEEVVAAARSVME